MPDKHFLKSHWPWVAVAATVAALAGAFIAMLASMPPRSIVMATGPEGGTYYELGKRYRAVLAQSGVDVRLIPTAGTVENLALLLDARSKVSVALMQGGIASDDAASQLESLGTVFYEPYWLFSRREVDGLGTGDLRGRKISIGPEGSGTRALSLRLLARIGIDEENARLLSLSPLDAAQKLLAGDIDIDFQIAAWDSPVVQQLLHDDRVTISGYPRADALVALFPFLTKLILPHGAADLGKDKPPADVVLIGSKASLVVRNDLHPAIQYLLLNAASEIHSRASVFNHTNEFPSAEALDFPLSSEALRYYKSGPPLLHEYFPFWMAELMGKLAILLIPILGVFYPLMRLLPAAYDWAMKSKVSRAYGELRLLESATVHDRQNGNDASEIIVELDRLAEYVNRLKVPAAYAGLVYDLRTHIALVRDEARKRAGTTTQRATSAKQ